MDQIVAYMKVQFDPMRFVIRERFKFWPTMQRRPRETIQKLAAHICQAVATCNFTSIAPPLGRSIMYALHLLGGQWSSSQGTCQGEGGWAQLQHCYPGCHPNRRCCRSCKVDGLQPKIRFCAGDCAKGVSPKASTSGSSQEGSASWTARCHRCGNPGHIATSCKFKVQLLQINQTLGSCASKESAFENSRCQMDRRPRNGQSSTVLQLWGSKASSAYPHQQESVYTGTGHCCRWKFHFYLSLDRVWQAKTSTGSVALPFSK